MSTSNAPTDGTTGNTTPLNPGDAELPEVSPARVGTIVWGLIVLALAALIIIARLGLVALDGTYVLIGLMLGAGAALVIGGLVSARGRDKDTATGKS